MFIPLKLIIIGFDPSPFDNLKPWITYFEWSPPTHSIWHIFWHFIWHFIWHIFWHFSGKTFWQGRGGEDNFNEIFETFGLPPPSSWNSIWQIFWHSFWHMYLAYLLTFYLVYLRNFFVVEVRRGTLCSGARGWGPAGRRWWMAVAGKIFKPCWIPRCVPLPVKCARWWWTCFWVCKEPVLDPPQCFWRTLQASVWVRCANWRHTVSLRGHDLEQEAVDVGISSTRSWLTGFGREFLLMESMQSTWTSSPMMEACHGRWFSSAPRRHWDVSLQGAEHCVGPRWLRLRPPQEDCHLPAEFLPKDAEANGAV